MTRRLKLICFIFLFLLYALPACFSQDGFGERLKAARNLDADRTNQVERLLSIVPELEETDYFDTIAFAHYFIAFRFIKLEKYEAALWHANRAENLFEKIDYSGKRRVNVYTYIIEANSKLKYYQNVVDYYEKHFANLFLTDYCASLAESIRAVAESYRLTGDYYASLTIIENFLTQCNIESLKLEDASGILLEKSIVEREMEDYQSSLMSCQLALTYELKIPESLRNKERVFDYYNQKALVLIELNKAREAITLLKNVLNDPELSKSKFCYIANNAASSLRKLNLHNEALGYSKNAFRVYNSLAEEEVQNKYQALDNLACSFMYLDQLDSAQFYMTSGLRFFQLDPNHLNVVNLKSSNYKKFICNLLYDQARIYLRSYELSGESKDLELANDVLYRLDSLVGFYLHDQNLQESAVKLKDEMSKYYQLAIDVNYQRNSIKDFLFFSEKNRGILLLEKLKKPEYSDTHLANSLQENLDALKQEKVQIAYLNSLDPNDSLKNHLVLKEGEILAVQSALKELNVFDPVDIIDIQSILDTSGDIKLYYQFGEDSLYLAILAPSNSHLLNLGAREEIINKLSLYFDQLSIRDSEFDKSLASDLYNQLIPDMDTQLDQVSIFPNGELTYLPFESLVTNEGRFLLEDFCISYGISFTLQEAWSKGNNVVKTINIASPDYDSIFFKQLLASNSRGGYNINLKYLAHAKNEAKQIASFFNAELIEGIDITKEKVIKTLQSSDIFHFAGHSILLENHNEYSFLALNQNYTDPEQILTVAEVYQLESDAKLVMLNACNTGKSDLISGEGVYNLSRAFLSGGTRSVVSSLWEVDDKASGEISVSFYKNLKQGMPKPEALRQSKLSYLNRVSSEQKKHPYYWAGIVLVGDSGKLSFHEGYHYYLAGLVILIIVLGFFGKKYFDKSKVSTNI